MSTLPPFPHRSICLGYHSVNTIRIDPINVVPRNFNSQMELLRRFGVSGVTIRNQYQLAIKNQSWPLRRIAITFDDGYQDNLDVAAPILKYFGHKATFYIISSRVGTNKVHNPDWITRFPGRPPNIYRYMNWDGIHELNRLGHEIGAHTNDHPMLDILSPSDIYRELLTSKNILEDKLGCSVSSICYPAGRHNELVLKIAEDVGYETGVITHGSRWNHCPRLTIPRSGIYYTDNMIKFLLKLSPFYRYLTMLRKLV